MAHRNQVIVKSSSCPIPCPTLSGSSYSLQHQAYKTLQYEGLIQQTQQAHLSTFPRMKFLSIPIAILFPASVATAATVVDRDHSFCTYVHRVECVQTCLDCAAANPQCSECVYDSSRAGLMTNISPATIECVRPCLNSHNCVGA